MALLLLLQLLGHGPCLAVAARVQLATQLIYLQYKMLIDMGLGGSFKLLKLRCSTTAALFSASGAVCTCHEPP